MAYKLYPQVDKFINYCEILCSHLKPKNTLESESAQLRAAYRQAVTMFYQQQLLVIDKHKYKLGYSERVPKGIWDEYLWECSQIEARV